VDVVGGVVVEDIGLVDGVEGGWRDDEVDVVADIVEDVIVDSVELDSDELDPAVQLALNPV
jgi:hypothetical protein